MNEQKLDVNRETEEGDTPRVNYRELFEELHSRPFPLVEAPARVSQIAVMNGEADNWRLRLRNLCESYGVVPPDDNSNCFYQEFGKFYLRWEQHTEFSTYTLIAPAAESEPFANPAIEYLDSDWVAELLTAPISAVHIELRPQSEVAVTTEQLRGYFEEQRLIGAEVYAGQAQCWTAFRLHRDGFGRVMVLNRGLNSCELGRLLRSILELENYRNMSLLALPVARSMLPMVTEMERELTATVETITAINALEDEKRALDALSRIAARTARLISNSTFRFSSAKAYYELALNRLSELDESGISGLQTLSDFLVRRLQPAYKTCQAVHSRLLDLAQRIDRASDLLRTRVDLAIQMQNQQLLKSMDKRSKLSLLIQRSVEGLSVVVITYYVLSLIRLMLNAAEQSPWQFNADITLALSTPVVLLLVWLGLRSLKKRIDAESK